MNPRWRRFLLCMTLIGCALVHASRLHQTHANVGAPQTHVASPSLTAPSAPIRTTKWQLQPWTFEAGSLPELEADDRALYLAKEQVAAPTAADAQAMSQDLAFFVDTDLATENVAAKTMTAFRRTGQLPQPFASGMEFAPLRKPHTGRGVNYVKPSLVMVAFDLANHPRGINVPIRPTNHPVVRTPQTSDGGSDVPTPVSGTPDPAPGANGGGNPATDGSGEPPSTGGGPGGDTGGLPLPGTGVGGLPPPTAIPEPSLISALICIGMLLQRRTRTR
jgi:hypothetical protein